MSSGEPQADAGRALRNDMPRGIAERGSGEVHSRGDAFDASRSPENPDGATPESQNGVTPEGTPSRRRKKRKRGGKRPVSQGLGAQIWQEGHPVPGKATCSGAQNSQTRTQAATTGSLPAVNSPNGEHPHSIAPPRNERGAAKSAEQRPNRYQRRPSTRSTEAPDSQKLYAALDLGTNNCRLLIARPEERGFRVVDAYSRIVRLGEGVGANRKLGEPAMERAIDALANCHRKLAERGVQRSRLIATEACRAAENGEEFIDRVRRETGLALEVVNRETEARLAVAGCVSLVDQQADGVILFDIGGGSSEIVWLDLRNRCGARGFALTRFIRAWTSLPVGVVNLAERHGGVHVTPDIFEAMVQDVEGMLSRSDLGKELTAAMGSGGMHMLGTSGTVTTLAGVHLGLKRYDRRRVDGTWLEDAQVGAMIDRLREMPYEERVENPCIGADRADLVLAGCAILEAIRRRWSCSRLRVADRGLREGILTELMSADGVWSRKNNGRRGRYRGKR
ncbi:Ppx/GppA phosphatase family protein [Roseibium sp.]|uniref:Ppx/GppA phosphatase family protein n=1 Tax=Roseibium sp. TaxID=1936156 RepID=UPI003A970E84